jgi:hypothetical protein
LEALKGAGFGHASSFWLLSLNGLVVATRSQDCLGIRLIFWFVDTINTKLASAEQKSPAQEPPQELLS